MPRLVARTRLKREINRKGLFLSPIAFEMGISRKLLVEYLAGHVSLTQAQLQQFTDSVDFDVPTPAQPLADRWLRNLQINSEVFGAVSENLIRHSVAYVIDGGQLATGTLIEVAGRVFIATASHTLPATPVKSIAIIGNPDVDMKGTNIPILRCGREKARVADVGYLEIDPRKLPTIGRSPIEVSRLLHSGPGEAGRIAFLYGFPERLVRKHINRRAREIMVGLRSLTYSGYTLAPEEWPLVDPIDIPPKRTRDIFLPYDQSTEMIVQGRGLDRTLPDLEGASGGGIWQSTWRHGEVWSTERVMLIGIQSRWNQRAKYARGVQISHLLNLLKRDIPELSPDLSLVARRRR